MELGCIQLSYEILSFISSGFALREAENKMEETQEKQIGIRLMFDCEYPHLFKGIFELCVVVYYLGEPKAFRQPYLAIFGSHFCSVYGEQATQQLPRKLASMGLIVMSGLGSRGIEEHNWRYRE